MNIAQRLSEFFEKFSGNVEFAFLVIISVFAFSVLYYYIIKFLFDNNSGVVVAVFGFVTVITGGIVIFNERVGGTIFLLVPSLFIVVVVALYSVELKRLIWTRKNMKFLDVKHGEGGFYDEEKIQSCIAEIIKALQDMSKNDIGAIIVLSTDNVPTQILDSGIALNSDISSELIESVFFPKTPLHDGAMIISGTKIVAAGCFLPLSQDMDKIPKDLGTRHRAGIGITETIDVVSLIVSEETGIISIARAGKITRYADAVMIKQILSKYYWQELEGAKK